MPVPLGFVVKRLAVLALFTWGFSSSVQDLHSLMNNQQSEDEFSTHWHTCIYTVLPAKIVDATILVQ